MVIGVNGLVAIISALISIPTSIIMFFLSQNYISDRNRRRIIRNIGNLIKFSKINKNNQKNGENLIFSVYMDKIMNDRFGGYMLIFLALLFGGIIFSVDQNRILLYWITTSVLLTIIPTTIYIIFERIAKSDRLKPYKFVFKTYPANYLIFLLIFISALLYSFTMSKGDELSLYIYSLALIIISIGIAPIIISDKMVPQSEKSFTMDLISDLFDFFLKDGYTMYAPSLIISSNGIKPICGSVIGLRKDVLIMQTDSGEEYVNWESILSFTVVKSI